MKIFFSFFQNFSLGFSLICFLLAAPYCIWLGTMVVSGVCSFGVFCCLFFGKVIGRLHPGREGTVTKMLIQVEQMFLRHCKHTKMLPISGYSSHASLSLEVNSREVSE